MPSPELKACPFCGGTAVMARDNRPGRLETEWQVRCSQCMAAGPKAYEDATAAEKWNARAKDAQ